MKKKKKVNKMEKQRVRFCQLDHYRKIVTGESSNIFGIEWYVSTDNYVEILYSNGKLVRYLINEGNEQLKQVIKTINIYLGGL